MIICGTGHRPHKLGGYGQDVMDILIKLALEEIDRINLEGILLPEGNESQTIDTVISGMALGWDQALALAAIQTNYKLVAAIPFRGQESRWPMTSQHKYHEILSKAYEITFVCAGDYESWKMQARNKYMVDRSNIVLALWDGSSGGTYNCIKYAEEKNVHIINLWEKYKSIKGVTNG